MDWPKAYHTEWSKLEKWSIIWYCLYVESKRKKDTNGLISETETHKHRKQTYGYQRGNMGGIYKLGNWD